ncbi:MAG: hypothetical protein NPIRA05_02240 [Nitrospirales bacterium]|nr:MAG: hypothetical protein NPIRA05_02240 [Nitrospirales bacterium]
MIVIISYEDSLANSSVAHTAIEKGPYVGLFSVVCLRFPMPLCIRHLMNVSLLSYRNFMAKSTLVFSLCVFCQFASVETNFVHAEVAAKIVAASEGTVRSDEQSYLIMQQQLRAYREKLQNSERVLEAFQQKHGIIAMETQITLLLQQRKALDDSLKNAENTAMGFKEKLAWVQSQIKHVPQDIPLSSVTSEQGTIGGAKNNLLKLQLEEQQLLTKYTEMNPYVQAIRKEMDVITRFIEEQETREGGSVTTGKNPLYREMEMQLFQTNADLISSEAQRKVLVQQIAGINEELERLRGLMSGLDELRRQVKADETNYLNYLSKVGTTPPKDYQVQVGDQLDIKFFFNPELNESISVRPDGRIALQLVGELSVVGHTVEEIREILIKNYSGQIKTPEIAVLLRTSHVLAGSVSQQGANSNVGASISGN